MTDRINQKIDELIADIAPLLNNKSWRYVTGIAEEAGELVGAYNKWADGRTIDKSRITEELIDTIACCLNLATLELNLSVDELMILVSYWYQKKIEDLKIIRQGSQPRSDT